MRLDKDTLDGLRPTLQQLKECREKYGELTAIQELISKIQIAVQHADWVSEVNTFVYDWYQAYFRDEVT
jgi:hypothetical protein